MQSFLWEMKEENDENIILRGIATTWSAELEAFEILYPDVSL